MRLKRHVCRNTFFVVGTLVLLTQLDVAEAGPDPAETRKQEAEGVKNKRIAQNDADKTAKAIDPNQQQAGSSPPVNRKQSPPPNPLQQLIRKFFRPANAKPNPAVENTKNPTEQAGLFEQDQIDLLAPQEASLTTGLRRIKTAIRGEDFDRGPGPRLHHQQHP